MKTTTVDATKPVFFRSLFANATGEFACNMEYPAQARVCMEQREYDVLVAFLKTLPDSVMSLDMRLKASDDFFDEGGETVDPGDLEDNPQFYCYRFDRRNADTFTFYLILEAKYHETYVAYELGLSVTGQEAV